MQSQKKKTLYKRVRNTLIALFFYCFIRFYSLFLRIEIKDSNNFLKHGLENDSALFAFWHDRTMLFLLCLSRSRIAKKQFAILASTSTAGIIGSKITSYLKIQTISGSSTRGGIQAYHKMQSFLNQGTNIIITPDGPIGPIHEVKRGAVKLAQTCNKNTYIINIFASRVWRLNTWDKHIIPKPFSRVILDISTLVPPISIDATREASSAQQKLLAEMIISETSISDANL